MDLGSWVAQPEMARFSDANLTAIAGDVSALRQSLQKSPTLGGLQLTTGLPAVLSGAASDLTVARSLLIIGALQLLLLTAIALLAAARLLASQREGETALLTARGATRWQLTRLTTAEVIPLCAAATAAGALAGAWLAGRLADSGPLRAVPLRLSGTWFSSPGLAALWAVLAIASGAVLLMVLPSLRKVTPGAVRISRGRQASIAGATPAGADIALVALAVLAGWQLRRYSVVATAASGTAGGIDPVLAVAPVLALAGGTAATLRLLPAFARARDWLAARGRKLTAAMAGWQFSRQPIRQGGTALLIVMAVATATLALAQHESWTRSASDQAAFTAGADVRVDMPAQPGPDTVRQPRDRGRRAARGGCLGPDREHPRRGPRRRRAPGGQRDAAAPGPVPDTGRRPVRDHRATRDPGRPAAGTPGQRDADRDPAPGQRRPGPRPGERHGHGRVGRRLSAGGRDAPR